MRQHARVALLLSILTTSATALADSTAASKHPTFTPADVASINKQMHALVDEKKAATGIVTLVMQGGRVVTLDAYGLADAEKRTPMRTDSVVAIASMTKPITGTAMMILYEQGKWALTDRVDKFVPELKDVKVMTDDGTLVAPKHAPTMRELMSHTAGFTYGFFGNSAVDQQYQKANILDPNSTLKDAVGKIAKLPLKHQPGTKWEYSVSVDIQGYIIEKLSGMPYDVFVRERVLKPLKMKDTDFNVSGDARNRLAQIHKVGANGDLVPALPPEMRADYAKKVPSFPSPGGSLFSTAEDYARFSQMMLNEGILDGVRILKPETVRLMRQSVLPAGVHVAIGTDFPGTGFGLDYAIVLDASRGEPVPNGTFYWSGIYGTYFWIDPANEIVVVGMIQRAWAPVGPDASFDPVYVRNEGAKIIYKALKD